MIAPTSSATIWSILTEGVRGQKRCVHRYRQYGISEQYITTKALSFEKSGFLSDHNNTLKVCDNYWFFLPILRYHCNYLKHIRHSYIQFASSLCTRHHMIYFHYNRIFNVQFKLVLIAGIESKPFQVLVYWTVLSRSQWQRRLRHEMSSRARTLASWVGIPLKAWMSVFILCLC
jgi:hypothetical protein